MIATASKPLLLCGLLAALTLHFMAYVESSQRFSIAHIAVKGNTRVTAIELIAKSGINEGESIFGFSLAGSASAIREIPWVCEARIARRFPNEVLIEITEREPVALVLSRGLFYIDGEGKVLEKFDSSERMDVPIVTAEHLPPLKAGDLMKTDGATDALEIIRAMNAMNVLEAIRISEINLDDPTNVLLIAEQSGANILMGSGDFRGKLWRLATVAEAINRNKKLQIANLERMDMRFETIVPVKFKGNS